jgi:hypothetical protein
VRAGFVVGACLQAINPGTTFFMSNDLVITGIPRSGTSYVCALLNTVENTVLVNEPVEALQLLRNDASGRLADYYAHTRDNILRNIPIQNKIVDGKFTEDTNENDVRNYYVPEVKDASFVFGSKNTFVYLVCLEKIRQQLPEAVILACVRHPYDVIASWKSVRFPHLKNANPMFFVDYAGGQERREIERMAGIREIEIRYALLWDYLAQCIIKSIDNLILLKYEEFVVDPAKHLAAVYRALGVNLQHLPEMPVSKVRTRREVLSVAEVDAIQKYCADSAGHFEYAL